METSQGLNCPNCKCELQITQRYPTKYSHESALNRDTAAERQVLESQPMVDAGRTDTMPHSLCPHNQIDMGGQEFRDPTQLGTCMNCGKKVPVGHVMANQGWVEPKEELETLTTEHSGGVNDWVEPLYKNPQTTALPRPPLTSNERAQSLDHQPMIALATPETDADLLARGFNFQTGKFDKQPYDESVKMDSPKPFDGVKPSQVVIDDSVIGGLEPSAPKKFDGSMLPQREPISWEAFRELVALGCIDRFGKLIPRHGHYLDQFTLARHIADTYVEGQNRTRAMIEIDRAEGIYKETKDDDTRATS